MKCKWDSKRDINGVCRGKKCPKNTDDACNIKPRPKPKYRTIKGYAQWSKVSRRWLIVQEDFKPVDFKIPCTIRIAEKYFK